MRHRAARPDVPVDRDHGPLGSTIVPPMCGYCAAGAFTLVTATSAHTVAAGQAFMVPRNTCIDLLTHGDDECVLLDLSAYLLVFFVTSFSPSRPNHEGPPRNRPPTSGVPSSSIFYPR